MFKSPRLYAWIALLALLAIVMPGAAYAAPAASYGGSVLETYNNCGLTQIFGTVLDSAGNPKKGVKVRLWWPQGSTFEATSGDYVRPETNEAGWDFFLDEKVVANTWYLAVVDGSGNQLSQPLEIRTSSGCGENDVNVAKVEFREGAASAPAPQPQPEPQPEPQPDPAPQPAPGGAEAAPAITAGATCRFYTETANGQGGYSVCDDNNARFLTAFRNYGLQNVGYPISRRYKRDGFITQAFQKAIFQWRFDGGYVAFVNVFDELSKHGFDKVLHDKRQTPYQLPDNWDGDRSFEQIVDRRQGLLNVRPALRNAYFSVSNPLLFFGLPTSEVTDMGNHYAIRLQRAVLQEWKEDVPWARAGQVTVANGGDIAREEGHLPQAYLQPEAGLPDGAREEASADPAPSQPDSGNMAPASGFGYGLQAHMIHMGKQPVFDHTKNVGFNWVKQQIEWKVYEPAPNEIRWGEMDQIINTAQANGVHVLFSVVGAPGWARESGHDSSVAGPPRDPQTFANFLGKMASRYCGKGLGAIEVWNEQNLHYEWGNRTINPAAYMNLLRPAYQSIKNACPSITVVSGALTPTGAPAPLAMDDFAYLEGMYRNGLKQYSDAIGAHPSGYNVPPNLNHNQACNYLQQHNASFMGPCDAPHHSWSFRSTIEGYRNIMVRYGDAGAKLWATEFGWAAGGAFHPNYGYANDNSFQEQAEWTVAAYNTMRNSGYVGAAFLWNLNFRVIANGTEKAQWGIVRNDWSPLPVYSAIKSMPK